MKETQILFNRKMIPRVLDGTKTQTRRMVRWPATYKSHEIADAVAALNRSTTKSIGRPGPCDGIKDRFHCPFGAVGDRLWVRETWQIATGSEPGDLSASVRYKDMETQPVWMPAHKPMPLGLTWNKWRPSIHMPRWASRITLEITRINIERLQDITNWDAKKEGIEPFSPDDPRYRTGFQELWDSIYSNWDDNPLVWVVEFRRVQP